MSDEQTFPESAIKKVLRTVVQDEIKPLKADVQAVKEEMGQMREGMRQVREEMGQMREEMRTYRDEVVTMKDEIVAELQTSREESRIHKGQHERFTEVEQRVEKLKIFIQRDNTQCPDDLTRSPVLSNQFSPSSQV